VKEEELLNLIRTTASVAARYALLVHAGLSPNVIDKVQQQQMAELLGAAPELSNEATKFMKICLESSMNAVSELSHVLRDETK
jgi:hypothetical protein